MKNILTICSDIEALAAISEHLQNCGYTLLHASSASEGLKIHREDGADVVLVILPVDDASGTDILRRLNAQDPRVIMVVCGKDKTVKGAPEALQFGAFEYLSNPLRDVNALLSVMGISFGARKSDAQLRYLRAKDAASADLEIIISECQAMRQVFAIIRHICHRSGAGTAPTVLLTGETGTGKGLIAKIIHYNSARRSRAFVQINCAAIPPTLIESELFGHVKGAFTDARASRAGLFETADGGTLFLDEISALPLELQVKLLLAIEEKSIRRVGASRTTNVNVQIIAATNRDLVSLVKHQEFREDLYHRLNVINIELPPLRKREEDKILLAEAFIREMCQQYGLPRKSLSEEAQKAIKLHSWPGNVRELRNTIERILLLEEEEIINAKHFMDKHPTINIKNDASSLKVHLPDGGCSLEALEQAVIIQALEKHNGNVSKTARYLDISRYTLMYRIKRYKLNVNTDKTDSVD